MHENYTHSAYDKVIAITVGAETNEKSFFNLAIWELFSVLFD